MAKINGNTSGLAPTETAPRYKPASKPLHEDMLCHACKGVLTRKRLRFIGSEAVDELLCEHCATFFGDEAVAGVTDSSPQQATATLAKIKEAGWAMILRWQGFAELEVEPGDIFKVKRVGLGQDIERPKCSRERTKEMFSVAVMVGPYEVTLWPHELSPLPFVTLMDLKSSGEVEEAYVSSDDEVGHFKPNDELRAMIYSTFGRLVNAP